MSLFDLEQAAFWRERTNPRPHDHPIVRAFARQRVAAIGDMLDGRVRNVLDVGCGDGFGTFYVRERFGDVHGCDRSLAMLRQNPVGTGRLCQADAYALPYRDRSFDLVSCWELLHHIHRPAAVLREMARVSRRYVLVFEPNSLNPLQAAFALLAPGERGALRFTPWFVRGLLVHSGLRPLRTLTVGCYTANRTPRALFPLLGRLPYRWPLVGVSNLALAEVPLRP